MRVALCVLKENFCETLPGQGLVREMREDRLDEWSVLDIVLPEMSLLFDLVMNDIVGVPLSPKGIDGFK